MLLTFSLRLGVFDFGVEEKYTENFIYSSEFRGKMRPNYGFETKKPTKSASYQKSTKLWAWSQNETKKNKTKKKAATLRSGAAWLTINKNLKTNNYNQQKSILFILHKLISLIHAIIEIASTVHINLGADRLAQSLQERIHGLQERRIACSVSCYHVACR